MNTSTTEFMSANPHATPGFACGYTTALCAYGQFDGLNKGDWTGCGDDYAQGYRKGWAASESRRCPVCHTKQTSRLDCPICNPVCACGRPAVKIRWATGDPRCEACVRESNAHPAAWVTLDEWRNR